MSIKETIELEVKGRSELRSVAGELDKIARALKTIKGSGSGPGAALTKHEQRIAQIRERSAGRLAQIRASGDERRSTAAALSAERQRLALARKGTAERKKADSFGGGGLGVKDLVTAELLAGALKTGADFAARAAFDTGKAILQAQAFREDVSQGLSLILRSKTEADAVMKQAAETADFIGQSRAEVSGAMLQFLTKGFDRQRSDEIVRRLSDLSTVDPTADFSRLQLAITQIAGKGRLQGQELLQLAEAGLETTSVYDELSKTLKKSRAEVIKLQETGKISSDVAIRAILDAIATQTGGKAAGEVSREKSFRDLSGLMRRLENIPKDLFFDLQVGPGVDGIKEIMRDIIEFFDAGSASGKEVRAVLGDTFNAIVEGLTGKDLSKAGGTKEVLQAIVNMLRDSKDDIREFASGIAKTAKVVGMLISLLGEGKKTDGGIGSWESLKGIMALINPVYGVWLAVSKVSGAIGEFLGELRFDGVGASLSTFFGTTVPNFIVGIPASLMGLVPSFVAAGASLIDGLISGIAGKVSGVVGAATGAAQSALNAVTGIFKSRSPSRVGVEIGGTLPWGLAVGVGREAPRAERAAAEMARQVIGGASGFSGPANGNKAVPAVTQGAAQALVTASTPAGNVVTINIENLHIGAESPEDAADRFADQLRLRLAEVA